MGEGAAKGRFRTKEFNRHADRLRAIHPRMGDYVDQAPVIAPATLGRLDPDQRRRLRAYADDGIKLKALMGALGLAYPLRKIPASAWRASTGRAEFLRAFVECHPSSLAQAIERNEAKLLAWLDWMWEWRLLCSRRGVLFAKLFDWGVRCVDARPTLDPAHMMDFIDRPSSTFSPRWTLEEFAAALKRWEETYTERDRLIDMLTRRGFDPERVFNYAPLPLTAEVEGLSFAALTTPIAIVEEGAQMRHCAAIYAGRVAEGLCWLYSLRSLQERVATLEVIWDGRRFAVEQVKARRNTPAPPEAESAAYRFVRETNAALNTAPLVARAAA